MTVPRLHSLLALKLGLAVVAVVLLSACGPEKEYVERFDWGYEHRSELEAWAAKEIDSAIEGTGVGPEGWSLFDSDPPLLWVEQRADVLASAPRGPCTVDVEGARPWRLEFGIERKGTEDAFAVAERVRAHWTAQGWVVTDVITPADMPGVKDPFISIRADREGEREMLAFMANPNIFVIDVYSVCSEDGSMVP